MLVRVFEVYWEKVEIDRPCLSINVVSSSAVEKQKERLAAGLWYSVPRSQITHLTTQTVGPYEIS